MFDKTNSEVKSVFQPSTMTNALSLLTHPQLIGGTLTLFAATSVGFSIPVSLGAAVLMVTVENVFIKIVSGGDTLRSSVYSLADHLSRWPIRGGLPFNTVPPMIKALNKLNSFNAKKAISALKGLVAYEQCFDYLGVNNYYLRQELINKVSTLSPEEILLFPLSQLNLSSGGHIMLGSLQRNENGNYMLRIHNGDVSNVSFHHKRIDSETGGTVYQTTMEINEINLEQINKLLEFSERLHSFHYNSNSSSGGKLYDFITELGGSILPPNSDSRYWMRNQKGCSCSGYSFLVFLQFILSTEEFSEYQKYLLDDSTQALKTGITNGFFYERTSEHLLAYNELRSKAKRMQLSDPGPIENVKPNIASKISSYMQNTFWATLFPYCLSSYTKDHLGIMSDDYRVIGATKKFSSIEDAMKCINSFKVRDEEIPSLIIAAKEKMTILFNTLDLTKLSVQDQTKITKVYNDFLRTEDQEILEFNKIKFYQLAFKTCLFEFRSARTIILADVIRFLKEEKYDQARSTLEGAYKSFTDQESQDLSEEELEECKVLLCQILYLEDGFSLEGLELRAGLAMLFNKLSSKNSDSFRIPEFINKNLDIYVELSLDKEFQYSSWKEDVISRQKYINSFFIN